MGASVFVLVTSHHWSSLGSGHWVLIMILEPTNQTVHRVVDSASITESIWCRSNILYSGPAPRLISQAKLARELLRCAEEIRDSLGVFYFFIS